MFECEEVSVDEHQPADHPQHHQPVAEAGLVQVEHLAGVEEELLHEKERHVHDGVAADEDGELDAGGCPELGPGDCVALGQEEQQQEETDLSSGAQHSPGQLGGGRAVAVHPVAHVGEGGEDEAGGVEEDGEPEEFEGGVQELSVLQLDGVTEGDAEEGEVEGEEDAEDGEDVELVSGVVVVEVVPWLAVGEPELVPESQALEDRVNLEPRPADIGYNVTKSDKQAMTAVWAEVDIP